MTQCECNGPGLCTRHNCHKTAFFYKKCKTEQRWFDLYESGNGPCIKNENTNVTFVSVDPIPSGFEPGSGVMEAGFTDQLTNFTQASFDHLIHGMPTVPDEIVQLRLEICRANTCGYFLEQHGHARCGHQNCGCFLSEKVTWARQQCPLDLWLQWTPENETNEGNGV